MAKKFNKEKYWANKYAKNVRMPQDIILNNLRMEQHFGNSGKPSVDASSNDGALRSNIMHQFAERKLNQNFREGIIDRLDQANNNLNVEPFKPIDVAAMPLTFDKRETLQMRMDPKEYIARERRDNFDFDGFYGKYKDTPLNELKDMVDGNGIDFGKFMEQHQNTPLSNIESSYNQSSNILEPFSSAKTTNVDNSYDYNQTFVEPNSIGNISNSSNSSYDYGSIYNQGDDIDYYNQYGTIGDTQNRIDSSTFKTDLEGINKYGYDQSIGGNTSLNPRHGYFSSEGYNGSSFNVTGVSDKHIDSALKADMDTINKNGFQSNFVDNASLSAREGKYSSDGFESDSINITGMSSEYNNTNSGLVTSSGNGIVGIGGSSTASANASVGTNGAHFAIPNNGSSVLEGEVIDGKASGRNSLKIYDIDDAEIIPEEVIPEAEMVQGSDKNGGIKNFFSNLFNRDNSSVKVTPQLGKEEEVVGHVNDFVPEAKEVNGQDFTYVKNAPQLGENNYSLKDQYGPQLGESIPEATVVDDIVDGKKKVSSDGSQNVLTYNGPMLSRDEFYRLNSGVDNPFRNKSYTEQEKNLMNEYDSSGGVKPNVDNYDFKRRFGTTKKEYANVYSELLDERDRIEANNKRIDSEQQAYDDELNEAQKIIDERNGNKAYENWKNEKNIKEPNDTFEDRFGHSKENYADEVGKMFDEKEQVEAEIERKRLAKERMLDDDLYFQYDKDDAFYKDVNILDKEKETKDPFDDIEVDDDEPDDFQDKTKKTKETKDPFDDIEVDDDEPDDFQDNEPDDLKNDEPDDFQDNEPDDLKNDEPDDFEKKFNKAKESGASEIDVEYDENGNPRLKSAKYKAESMKSSNKTFDYNTPTKDTINAKEYAKQIYGKNVTDAQVKQLVEGYAESDSGIKKQMYEPGFDFGKVNMKTTGDNAESIGRVIADIKGDGVINNSGVFDPEAAIKAVDGINGPFNKESVLKGFKSQAYKNRFDKEYKAFQEDLFRMSEDLNNSKKEVRDIVKKIQNDNPLTPKEAKAFHKHQVKLKTYHDNVVKWAEDRGFDPESIFGERFKSKGKGKDKYKGTRDWMFNTDSINNINNELDLLDTRVNLETGEYTTKKTEARDAMKDDLNSLLDSNAYKSAYEKSNIKDSYLDYLKENSDALTSDNAKKLYNLQQQGVDIGNEGKQVLQGLAIAHEGKLDGENGAVKKLNTAIGTLSSENYMNISDENIEHVGKELKYENNKYQLDMSQLNLTDDQKSSFKKIIESDNVGKENLKDIFDASIINNAIKDGNTNDKDFNKIVTDRFNNLKDSTKSTGIDIREQLKRSGIENNEVIDEIVNAKKNGTSNISAQAKVELAKMKNLDQNDIDFGNLSADKMKEMVKKNKTFFGANGDVDNMNEKTLRGLFGKAFENTDGKLSAGYKFKVKGKDVTTAEGFTEFYNSILSEDGKGLNWDAVFKSVGATEEGKEKFQEVFDWLEKGNDYKDFKKMNIASGVKDYLVNMFEKADENIEGLDKKTIEQIKSHAAALKNTKMEDVAKKVDVDSITSEIGKFNKIGKESSGVVDKLKLGGKAKTIGYAAAGIAALGGLGMMASNAAEERERKRQEMQQLMMAQNQSIRGGY